MYFFLCDRKKDNIDDLKSTIISHFVLLHCLKISIQCKLNFFFLTIIILSKLSKFANNGAAVGPITKENLALGFSFNKCSKTPVDKILSPIKFEQIANIFTGKSLQIK